MTKKATPRRGGRPRKTKDREQSAPVAAPAAKRPALGPERIEPGLLPLAVPIGSLKLWEANYRHGDVGAVSESLKRFGQKKPVVAQAGTGIVVAGNHVLKAAQALGWKRLAVVSAEMSDEDATAFAIADNRSSDMATNDDAQLTALLKRMMEDGGPEALVGTGYDGEDLDRLLADVTRDESQEAAVPDYRIIVFCHDEGHQAMTCQELEAKGLKCQLLTL